MKLPVWIVGGWSDKHQAYRRPLWQVPVFLVLFVLYWPANKFVDWMDRH